MYNNIVLNEVDEKIQAVEDCIRLSDQRNSYNQSASTYKALQEIREAEILV